MADRTTSAPRLLLEVAGFGLIATAGWLIHISLGLLVLGVAALNWAYGASR